MKEKNQMMADEMYVNWIRSIFFIHIIDSLIYIIYYMLVYTIYQHSAPVEIVFFAKIFLIAASPIFKPSTAALTIPPAYPAPSPQG